MIAHTRDLFRLNEKVCFITGGTSGLGMTLALAFAEAGAVVTVGSTNPEKVANAQQQLGDGHLALQLDVVEEDSVRQGFRTVLEKYDRFDILVNAAGVIQRKPSLTMSTRDWERILRINVTGTFIASREAAAIMHKQAPRANSERGCLLNFASIAAFAGFKDTAAYGVSKAAIVSLTHSLANDWAQYGIRVNALAPGVIPTDLNRSLVEGTPRGEALLEHTPAGRFGQPEEIVGAALYLCSDAAPFTTGVVLPVDGGFLSRGVGA